MSKRVSKWRRREIIKLLQMAGWSSRQGSEGQFILQKGDLPTITLGSDPVHKNAIAEVQRALGFHVDQVIRKRKGHPTSRNQIRKRLTLAKQMDAAGFDGKMVQKTCSLGGLYEVGFRLPSLRDREPDDYADEIYKTMMGKKGVKVTKQPRKNGVASTVGSGRLPPVEEGTLVDVKIPIIRSVPTKDNGDDINALLELMSVFGNQLDDLQAEGNRTSAVLAERLKHALEQSKHVKYLHNQYTEELDKLIAILEEPA